MNKHIPTKMTCSKDINPWITREIRRMSKTKQRLYTRVQIPNISENWETYKDYQKESQMIQRHKDWSFLDTMFDNPDDK